MGWRKQEREDHQRHTEPTNGVPCTELKGLNVCANEKAWACKEPANRIQLWLLAAFANSP